MEKYTLVGTRIRNDQLARTVLPLPLYIKPISMYGEIYTGRN